MLDVGAMPGKTSINSGPRPLIPKNLLVDLFDQWQEGTCVARLLHPHLHFLQQTIHVGVDRKDLSPVDVLGLDQSESVKVQLAGILLL